MGTIAISTLPIGSKIKMGTYSVEGSTTLPIIWKIIDQNHSGYPANSTTLHTEKNIDLRAFDGKEPSNTDTNRQQYGNHRWKVSNIRLWLNSTGGANSWYSAQHTYDAPPTDANMYNTQQVGYADIPGFLNNFTSTERSMILPTTLHTNRNDWDGGTEEIVTDNIFLLSTTELGGTCVKTAYPEGVAFSCYSTAASRVVTLTDQAWTNTKTPNKPSVVTNNNLWWTRSVDSANASYTSKAEIISTTGTFIGYDSYNGIAGIRPALNISNATTVSDTVDADGCYVIKIVTSSTATLDTTETIKVADTSTVDTTETVQVEDTATIETTESVDSPYVNGLDSIETTEFVNIAGDSSLEVTEYINISDIASLEVTEFVNIAGEDSLGVTEYVNAVGSATLTITERVKQKATATLTVTETTKPPIISSKATLPVTETIKAPTLTTKQWFEIPVLQVKTQDRDDQTGITVYDQYALSHGTISEHLRDRDIIVTIDKNYADLFLNATDMRIKATLGDVNLSVYPTYAKDVIGGTGVFYPYYKSSTPGEAVHQSVRNMTTKGGTYIQDDTTSITIGGLVEDQRSTFSFGNAMTVINDWFFKKYTSIVLTSYDVTPTGFPDYKDSSITITDTTQSVRVCDVSPMDRIKIEIYAQKVIPQTASYQTIETKEYVKHKQTIPTTETIERPSGYQTITVKETVAEVSQLPTSENIIGYDGEIIYTHETATIQALEQIVSPTIDIRQLVVTETVSPAPKASWHRIPIKQVKVVRCPNYGGGGIPIPNWSNGWNVTWSYGNEPVKSEETIYDPSGTQNFLESGMVSDSSDFNGRFIAQAWNNPVAQIVPMNDYHVVVKLDREYMDKLTDIQRARFEVFSYNYEGEVTAQLVDDELGDSDYIRLNTSDSYGELFTTPYAANPPGYTQYEQQYTEQVEVLQDWYEAGHDTIVLRSFFSPGNSPQIYASNLNASQDMDFWIYGIESDTTTPYKNPSSAILEVVETVGTTVGEWIEVPVDQVKFVDWQTGEKTGSTSNARSGSQYEWIDMYTHNAMVKLNDKVLSTLADIYDIKIVATTYNYDGVVTARSVNDTLLSNTVEGRRIYVYYDDNNPSEIKYVDGSYGIKSKYYCDYKTGVWTYAGDNASLNDLPIEKYSFLQTEGYKQIGSGYNAGDIVTVPIATANITTSTWYTSRASQRTALGTWFDTKQVWYTDEQYPVSTQVDHNTIMFGSALLSDAKLYGGDSLSDYKLKVYVLATKKSSSVARLTVTETITKNKISSNVILPTTENIIIPNHETHTLPVTESVILPTFDNSKLDVTENIILPTFGSSTMTTTENVLVILSEVTTLKTYEMVVKPSTGDTTVLTSAQRKMKRMNEKVTELINAYGSSVKVALVNLYKDDITGTPGGTIIDQIQGDVKAFITTLTPQYNPFDMFSGDTNTQMVSAYECYIGAQYYKDFVRWGWANSMSSNYNDALVLTKGVFVQHRGLWFQVNLPELNSVGDQDVYLKLTMVYSNNTIRYLNTL